MMPSRSEDTELRDALHGLRQEQHRLKAAVAEQERKTPPDQIRLQHLRRKSARVLGRIRVIEDRLTPDIIA